jgi:septal ring factor EnvC (AmiA/AmiB activator)
MSQAPVVIDRESITNSFRAWHDEQQQLDAQLAESVAALDAFQTNLERWQQELVQERDELKSLREQIESCQDQPATAAVSGNEEAALEQLRQELEQARGQISALTADLALARAHELELGEALSAEQHAHDTHAFHQDEAFDEAVELVAAGSYRGDTAPTGKKRSEPRGGASPVLGSVMEQFGKLREQRSQSRSNTKPRL